MTCTIYNEKPKCDTGCMTTPEQARVWQIYRENTDRVQASKVECLAQLLHESGREAVLSNKVLKKDGAPIGQIVFIEWDNLFDDAKEGRRMQARYLLRHVDVRF